MAAPFKVTAVERVGVVIVAVTPLAMSMVVEVAPALVTAVNVALASTSNVDVPEVTTELMTGVPPATILSVLPLPNRMRLDSVASLSVPDATEVMVSVLAAAVVTKSKPAAASSPLIASAPVPEKVIAPAAFANMIVRLAENVIAALACDIMMPVQLVILALSTRTVLASSMVIVPVPAPAASLVLMFAAVSAPASVLVTQLSARAEVAQTKTNPSMPRLLNLFIVVLILTVDMCIRSPFVAAQAGCTAIDLQPVSAESERP